MLAIYLDPRSPCIPYPPTGFAPATNPVLFYVRVVASLGIQDNIKAEAVDAGAVPFAPASASRAGAVQDLAFHPSLREWCMLTGDVPHPHRHIPNPPVVGALLRSQHAVYSFRVRVLWYREPNLGCRYHSLLTGPPLRPRLPLRTVFITIA